MAELLYDADCGFCRRVLRRYARFLRRDVRALPLQEYASPDARLSQEELQKAITLVLDNGLVYSGAEAIARAIGGPARIYFVPGIRQLADLAYGWVARNRGRLPGSCSVR